MLMSLRKFLFREADMLHCAFKEIIAELLLLLDHFKHYFLVLTRLIVAEEVTALN
jgi:hypothetical protein